MKTIDTIYFFFGLWMLRNLVVLLHEIGHAVPTLLLTRQKTTIFLGSYGIPTKGGRRFSIGKLEIWFTTDFLWNTGMCSSEATDMSRRDQIIQTLCGPLLPLAIATAVFFTAGRFAISGVTLGLLFLFLVIAVIDTCYNLLPRERPVRLTDGTTTFNDGKQLQQVFREKKFQKIYRDGISAFETGDYARALHLFGILVNADYTNISVFRLLTYAALALRRHENVKSWAERTLEFDEVEANDYINAGLAHSRLEEMEQAIAYYDKSLELLPGNPTSLNNKGYSLAEMGRFEQAEAVLSLAIAADADYAYPHNNRAYVKIMTGRFESALSDLEKSMRLDDSNAFVYRNFGLYYLKNGNKTEALRFLEKARSLNPETERVDLYLQEASQF
ncbi:tetratricopeptide repeat protein [Flavobacterium selenitireducens]|uniref:tetratricopeptide repeat protein n=1 Tax=Flavobacterium selenitireducens TaxID=2722704 RepID=UPI00168BCA4E|nr:tetratricopeptide repeat protein [Flavobacterium selenitireducens]MBD3583626.1 tetratricopeptide repeat protein [Flavobacterium selenitireducens]